MVTRAVPDREMPSVQSALATLLSNMRLHIYLPYTFPGGWIYLDVAESPMMLARALGNYEVEKLAAVRHFLKAGQTFIDVGVNKGDFSLVAARMVGANGRVLAFEPEPTNCHWIEKSIGLNGYTNVQLFPIALSDRSGTADLYLGQKSGWHSLLAGHADRDCGTITVATRTLDEMVGEQRHDSRVDLIKIDVEGAELLVLRGAVDTLRNNPAVTLLIDIHPILGVNPRSVCDFLREEGFSVFRETQPFDIPVGDDPLVKSIVARRPAAMAC
jgi:FkbM family methyltransferase